MKAVIVNDPKPPVVVKYPALYLNRDKELLVLFTSERTGIILTADLNHRFGAHVDYWISCLNKSEWELFNGEVVLSND